MTYSEDRGAEAGEPASAATDLSGQAAPFTTSGWPEGYEYRSTHYADVILKNSFPARFADLVLALNAFRPSLTELRQGGGGRTVFVKRFDDSLAALHDGAVWGKRNITIEKKVSLDGTVLRTERVRGHEIDMLGNGTDDAPIPAIAVEMEWNNKDPFYDRDLVNFQALHGEGAIAIGVIVTRGPRLQSVIGPTIQSRDGGYKYGQSSTHWDKLIPRVNLGGGGSCPLILIGIEPERIDGIELAVDVRDRLAAAEVFRTNWRGTYAKWADAKPHHARLVHSARALLPPLADVVLDDDAD